MEYDLLAVGDAALEAARAIGATAHPAGFDVFFVGIDLVVNVGSLSLRRLDAEPDLHRFHRRYRHQSGPQAPIELAAERHVRAESDRYSVADRLGDSAECVSL